MKLVMLGWIFSMAATAGLLAGEERKVTFHDVRFRTYEIDPSKEKLELIWRDEKGKPYKNLRTAQKAFAAKGRPLKFITNGGIYETDGKPLGLHVEEGIELVPLNKKFVKDGQPGWGNFYLEPGGVFSLDQDGIGCSSTHCLSVWTDTCPSWGDSSEVPQGLEECALPQRRGRAQGWEYCLCDLRGW